MRFLLGTLAVLALSGCVTPQSDVSSLKVSKTIVSYVRDVVPGMETAAYLAFDNQGGEDRLLSVHCNCADRVEIHHMVGEGADRKMVIEPHFVIPGNARSAIEPPGLEWHLMLRDVKQVIPIGSEVEMTLEFEHAGEQNYRFVAVDGTKAAWDRMGDQ